jgi:hypothetical protein
MTPFTCIFVVPQKATDSVAHIRVATIELVPMPFALACISHVPI